MVATEEKILELLCRLVDALEEINKDGITVHFDYGNVSRIRRWLEEEGK